MATLEKIRSKGIIIASVVGLSLLAFILGDLLDSRQSLFSGNKQDVGEIAGTTIPIQQLEQKINELTEIHKMNSGQGNVDEKTLDGIREQAWQQITNDMVMGKEYDKLGLTVSSDELFDLVQGANPHQIIRQIFTNPQTGEFNKSNLLSFLKNMDQDQTGKQKMFWLYVEDQIKSDRMNTKYTNLIRKGLSAPTFLAKNDFIENNKKTDFNYILLRYNSISDSAVKITSSDLKKYYNDHKFLFDQTASRDIEYVSFDVLPSKSDISGAEDWISKVKPDFNSTTEVEQFVNGNSDIPYNDKSYKPGQLPDSLDNFMFRSSVGDVYGPYLDNGSYKLARLYKVVNLPDSVKARHILISPKAQTKEATLSAKVTADSIKNLLDKGGDFAVLAMSFSDDKSNAEKGGDLGWFQEGLMVKPFNDAAFEGKKGETKVIETRFGYHILQVLDKSKDIKKVKVAVIERKIEPSQPTFNKVYADANKFAATNRTYEQFNAAITKQNFAKKLATNIAETDKAIPGLEQPRAILRWMYSSDKLTVSEPIDLGDRYVVAALTAIRKKGTAPIEQVKAEVELQVRKEKKAEKLAEQINKAKSGVSNIQDLGLKLNVPVEVANGISFSTYSLPSSGIEPKVIAAGTNFGKSKISEPINGNNGVYVLYVSNITNAPLSKDYADSKQRMGYTFQTRASYDSYNSLRKLAKIVDNRAKFY